MKFYVVRNSTDEIIMTLYEDDEAKLSYQVYKWYGDNEDIDLVRAEIWDNIYNKQKKGKLK